MGATRHARSNAQGMKAYPPMEIMREETSRAVMGGLLIHDVCNTAAECAAAGASSALQPECRAGRAATTGATGLGSGARRPRRLALDAPCFGLRGVHGADASAE